MEDAAASSLESSSTTNELRQRRRTTPTGVNAMDHKIQSTTNNTTATVPTANETPAIEYEEESIATVDDDDDNNNKDDNDDDANQPLPPPPVALPDTPIPTKQRKKVTIAPSMETISSIKNNNSNIIIHNNHLHDQNQNKEAKLQKIVSRVVFGACMFSVFLLLVFMGHLYICALVALIELLLFNELVRVRYSAYYEQIQDTIPLFRTTQWMWFAVAIFYTYGDFATEIATNNSQMHYMLHYTQYLPPISFLLYSGTFVVTIATLQRDSIKFQINQLCWTILVLCLTVGQLKYIMHNVYNGLIWFVLPCCLVFANDIMAYASGVTCGRKFIQRQFISFSPNKTWEGFIGGGFFTMIASWQLSRFLAQFTWMTCPTNEFRWMPVALTCDLDPIFQPAQSFFPSQVFELMPRGFVKVMFPRIIEICSVRTSTAGLLLEDLNLTRCISGESTHIHHHFELSIHKYYPIQMHALWLGLFASLVAPFGGFLASAIKRAYGIKDFASIIPGHGGVMDRMDCQFLMALYTWVHYNSFVKFSTVSVPKMTYMYSLLTEQEKTEFLGIVLGNVTSWRELISDELKELESY